MPEKRTIEAAKKDLRSGKSPSTAAGEFVRQEIEHVREGKHGVKNAKQAIAIGLSEARRAGVPIPDNPNRKSRSSSKIGSARTTPTSPKRARASLKRLKSLPHAGASHLALSRQAHQAATHRSASSRSVAAKKAARTRARAR
jgi:hypothetical protein